MRNLPELKIKIGADGSAVAPGAMQAKKSLKDLDKEMSTIAKNAAKAGLAIGAGFAAGAAAIATAAKSAARTVTEIDNLARVANTSTTTFQKWAAAARTMGVEQEKVSDALKDVTERVGEFIATGGGPMADFFENIAPKVGVTADQFARLSGPEALQLYVSSLEKAGLSQEQMTFYLESMSGDLTRLLPLLRNGGAELNRLGDAAEKAGGIFSKEEISAGREMQAVFDEIGHTLQTSTTKAVLEHKKELIALATWISETGIPALADFTSEIGKVIAMFAEGTKEAVKFGKAVANALGDTEGPVVSGSKPVSDGDNKWSAGQGDPSYTGTWPLDDEGNVIIDDGGPNLITKPEKVVPSTGSTGGKGKSGGGKSKDNTERDLDRIQRAFMTEQEVLQDQYDQRLEQLQKAREAELLTEEQYNALKLEAQAKFNQQTALLDQEAMQAKMDAWSGALGDLSTLMMSGNKKLFAIGKASATAQAVVDGYSAAVTAWDRGMKVGGPPAAAAFTAASLARTGAMIASLKSAQFDGGGSKASSAGGSSATTAAVPQAPLEVLMRIDGGGNTATDWGNMLEQLNKEAGDRGYRILVAR